jgi:hypothetical protein
MSFREWTCLRKECLFQFSISLRHHHGKKISVTLGVSRHASRDVVAEEERGARTHGVTRVSNRLAEARGAVINRKASGCRKCLKPTSSEMLQLLG